MKKLNAMEYLNTTPKGQEISKAILKKVKAEVYKTARDNGWRNTTTQQHMLIDELESYLIIEAMKCFINWYNRPENKQEQKFGQWLNTTFKKRVLNFKRDYCKAENLHQFNILSKSDVLDIKPTERNSFDKPFDDGEGGRTNLHDKVGQTDKPCQMEELLKEIHYLANKQEKPLTEKQEMIIECLIHGLTQDINSQEEYEKYRRVFKDKRGDINYSAVNRITGIKEETVKSELAKLAKVLTPNKQYLFDFIRD